MRTPLKKRTLARRLKAKERDARFFSRVLAHADIQPGSAVHGVYQALGGYAAPPPLLLASNLAERAPMRRELRAKMSDLVVRSPDIQVAAVIIRNEAWSSPSDKCELRLTDVRGAKRLLERLAPHAIAGVRIAFWPRDDDWNSFVVVPELVALIYGFESLVALTVEAKRMKLGFRSPTPELASLAVQPLDVGAAAIGKAAITILNPGTPSVKRANKSADDRGFRGWRKGADFRAFTRFQMLSLARMKDMLIATGDGVPFVKGMLVNANHRVKRASKQTPSVVHQDAVPHAWWAEQARMIQDPFPLPFVKVR